MHVIDLERLPHKTLISDIKAPFKPLQLVLNREQNQEFTILSLETIPFAISCERGVSRHGCFET